MRLGLNLGYWSTQRDRDAVPLAQEAERLGYAVVWAAEAYGSDAPTVLSWIAAHTERIDVGSAVMQIPARTPAATAMTAATIDEISGGRFRLGLGVSGPQVAEGWHGVPFANPLGRTREYVEIVRRALSRDELRYDGRYFQLPLPGGAGKPLRLSIRPPRPDLPVYLAAIGPKNLELAGELADGWLGVFFAPEHTEVLDSISNGRSRAGKPMDGFDIVPTVPVVLGDDVEECADAVRPYAALYLGGMGSRRQNFYNQLAVRMGFGAAADRVQDLFLDGKHRAAAGAIPLEFLDRTALIGPVSRVRDRLPAYAEAGVTTLALTPHGKTTDDRLHTLRAVAEALAAVGMSE